MVNGRIDKYQFEEGYCQAEKDYYNSSRDYFTFCYYDQDHLGNIRQVTEDDGSKKGEVIQSMNYYPFGAEFCDGSANTSVQKHKYNGKEFDNMHGLNSYDYGARQYNPVTARWDRVDPLAEKYYGVSPYNYCMNNPVRYIDPDGRVCGDYYDLYGNFIATDGINDGNKYMVLDNAESKAIKKSKNVSNVKNAMKVPTNYQIDQGQAIINKGQETELETGFVMGGGTTSNIITGDRSSIQLAEGYDQIGGCAESDAHYQPFDWRVDDDQVQYSTSEPSDADKTIRKVREDNGLNVPLCPSWVIGEEPNNTYFTRDQNGNVPKPSTTTSIRFLRNGGTTPPIPWKQFKKAVYKINKSGN